ncbi:MAG: hypothetical protein ACRC3H_06705 [Lachnospiraceae bacterium]
MTINYCGANKAESLDRVALIEWDEENTIEQKIADTLYSFFSNVHERKIDTGIAGTMYIEVSNMADYKILRNQLMSGTLRHLCIERNWYTCGTNEEYENLFDMVDKETLTTDDIVEITQDIIDHSEISTEEEFEDVAFEVLQITTTFLAPC